MKTDNITIIIKPTNACNLRCSYCYNDYDNYSKQKMSPSLFRDFLELLSKEYRNIKLIWHGGEPLLMGRDFYNECFEIESKYIQEKNICFTNSMQTNATLIDSNWCDFIKKNKIKIGISFDGPPYGLSGRNGTDMALKSIELLKNSDIRFGAIAVINKFNIGYLNDIYDFFSKENISASFNCVFEAGRAEKESSKILINEDEYFENFKDIFLRWIYDDTSTIRLDPFAQMIETIEYGPRTCENSGCLYRYLSLDSAGNIYPCGRFNKNNIYLGRFYSYEKISDIFQCEEYNNLTRSAIERRKKCLKECKIYSYCNGGCNADAMYNGNIALNGFVQCNKYKKMLLYIMDFYNNNKNDILKLVKNKRVKLRNNI